HLVEEGFLTAASDPGHKQRTIYSLTEKAIALVPVMAQLGAWGACYLPATPELSARALALDAGGPLMWADFKDELRHLHLGTPKPRRSVLAELEAAYRAAG